jgi:hypothetical protein
MAKKKQDQQKESMLEAICPKCGAAHVWDEVLWKKHGEKLTHCIAQKSYEVDKNGKFVSEDLCNTSLKRVTHPLGEGPKPEKKPLTKTKKPVKNTETSRDDTEWEVLKL